MSVAILGHNDFGQEDNSEDFEYMPVAGEHRFIALWEPAIEQLGITRLSNGTYLKREELPDILEDFQKIKEWIQKSSEFNEEAKAVIARIDWLLIELPLRWEKCPEANTLWMG